MVQKPKNAPIAVVLIVFVLIFLILVYVGFRTYELNNVTEFTQFENTAVLSPSPFASPSITSIKPTVSPSPSPTIAVSPSPTNSALDYKVPEGETYLTSSTADTNGDSKDETLVITKMANGNYHAYVLSSTGQSLFDNKELLRKPLRISTQTYDPTKETYLTWMLIFTEQSGDLAYIHWNGTSYEIPLSSGI